MEYLKLIGPACSESVCTYKGSELDYIYNISLGIHDVSAHYKQTGHKISELIVCSLNLLHRWGGTPPTRIDYDDTIKLNDDRRIDVLNLNLLVADMWLYGQGSGDKTIAIKQLKRLIQLSMRILSTIVKHESDVERCILEVANIKHDGNQSHE